MPGMLELDDIQHILLTRTPAMTGRYEFLTFDRPAGGRAWLRELMDRAQSAADVRDSMEESSRWITLAFTWTGLRALGVPEDTLNGFPDAFREGMAARADILGDVGPNSPQHWDGGLAGGDLHAIAILFARDDDERRRCVGEHDALLARCDGVRSLSFLDLNAHPPFNYAHDHFGFRDRLSQPVIEGSGEEPTPGSGAPLKPGEFILGDLHLGAEVLDERIEAASEPHRKRQKHHLLGALVGRAQPRAQQLDDADGEPPVALERSEKIGARKHEQFRILLRDGVGRARTAVEHGDLAEQIARPKNFDGQALASGGPGLDADLTATHAVQRIAGVALDEQRLARRQPARLAQARQRPDRLGAQPGKQRVHPENGGEIQRLAHQ